MKKVIRHGNRYEYRATCVSCHCLFAYNEEDTETSHNGKPYVECPECGTTFCVEEKETSGFSWE